MMSQYLPRDTVIICSENISNDYKITTSELLYHAERLGVNHLTEHYLLPIVLKGLVHPLPADWIPCFDTELGEFFYYHPEDNISQWEHPIDEHYRNLISKIRNEYSENLKGFLSSEDNSDNLDMLPLRQNRKPQLLPIKQLLKFKDEEKITADDKIFKTNLHSSLKKKNEFSSGYKKSVVFITDESISEKNFQFSNDESEKPLDMIQLNKSSCGPETISTLKTNDDFRNLHEHGQYTSDDNSKLEVTPFSKNLNRKITSLKQSFNKSNSEIQPSSNNFKRLHINLRQPDSVLFSDSYRDDTIKNILSASTSSELVSEEEESPPNVLTNITESGIDVNTVTDLQKLKAKNKLIHQNSNADKQISRNIDISLRSAIARLEHNLNVKFEEKISEEIMKLKKLDGHRMESYVGNSSPSLEKQNNYEILVNETQERFEVYVSDEKLFQNQLIKINLEKFTIRFKIFKEEIEKEMKENQGVLKELQNKYDVEMDNLKDNLNKCLKFCEIQHNYLKNSENFQKQLQRSLEERSNNIEQISIKRVENLETRLKTKLEEFRTEKEKILAEYYEKFKFFMNENQEYAVKFWQGNSITSAVQGGLNELFAMEMRSDDPIFQSFEKVLVHIMNAKRSRENVEDIGKKNIATQTEKELNLDEIMTLKENMNEISTKVKYLVEGTTFSKRFETNDILRKDSDDAFLYRSSKKFDNPIRVQLPLKVESFKTDFSPFEEFSSHIDKELNRYRKRYLSNTKWSNFGINEDDV